MTSNQKSTLDLNCPLAKFVVRALIAIWLANPDIDDPDGAHAEYHFDTKSPLPGLMLDEYYLQLEDYVGKISEVMLLWLCGLMVAIDFCRWIFA